VAFALHEKDGFNGALHTTADLLEHGLQQFLIHGIPKHVFQAIKARHGVLMLSAQGSPLC